MGWRRVGAGPSHLLRRRSRFLPKRSDRRPRSAASPGRPGRRPSSRLQNTGPAAAAAMETHRFRFRRETTLLTIACGDTGRRARVRTAAGGRPHPQPRFPLWGRGGGRAGAGALRAGAQGAPSAGTAPPAHSAAGKWGGSVQTPRSSSGWTRKAEAPPPRCAFGLCKAALQLTHSGAESPHGGREAILTSPARGLQLRRTEQLRPCLCRERRLLHPSDAPRHTGCHRPPECAYYGQRS